MTDLAAVWHFTRGRLDAALQGLTDDEMEFRPYTGAHTVFEIVYHVCGAEHFWASRMGGAALADPDLSSLLERSIYDGFLRAGDPPFGPSWRHRAPMEDVLRQTFAMLRPIMEYPTPHVLELSLTSPIGDPVTGRQGLIRLAQHAGYHTGQIQMIRTIVGKG